MDYLYQVYRLSADFEAAYPHEEYPELLYKPTRPYSCLLIDTKSDYFICVPFRSSINHKNAFMFTSSARSLRTKSGLDYSKIAIIKDSKYLSDDVATVDNDEYSEMRSSIDHIVEEAVSYVETYVDHVRGTQKIHDREFERKYRYSTLPYFHDILKIEKTG